MYAVGLSHTYTRHTIRDELDVRSAQQGHWRRGCIQYTALPSPVSGGIYCSAQASTADEPDGAALAALPHAGSPSMHKSSFMQQLKAPLTLLYS